MKDKVTLALAPTSRGFGFVAFEHPEIIMDWGVKEVRKNKERDSLLKARVLMHMLQPSVLVIENVHRVDSRRSERVKTLIEKLADVATEKGIKVMRYSRKQVLTEFGKTGAHNKDKIAAAVAQLVPELAHRLPPPRRIWESEHYNMGIFEAAALALTHYAQYDGEDLEHAA